MRWRDLWDLLKITAVEWWNDNTFRLAASLAFYTIFSLAPLIVIATAIVSAVLEGDPERYIVEQLRHLVGDEGGEAVSQIAKAVRDEGSVLPTTISGVLLLVGATVVFAELQSALNQIWDVRADSQRGMIRRLVGVRLRSFAIALAVGFLLLVSLIVSAILAAAEQWVSGYVGGVGWASRLANLLAGYFVIAALFAMIYKFLPDVKITWRDVAIGALVTALLFSVGRYLIGLYLGQAAVGSTYGAAGSFAVLLIWVYYSALICFFGAEFTQVFARRHGSRIRPEEHATRVGAKSDRV